MGLRRGYDGVTKGIKGNQPLLLFLDRLRPRRTTLALTPIIRRLSFGLVHSSPSSSQVWVGPDFAEKVEAPDNILLSIKLIGCARGEILPKICAQITHTLWNNALATCEPRISISSCRRSWSRRRPRLGETSLACWFCIVTPDESSIGSFAICWSTCTPAICWCSTIRA